MLQVIARKESLYRQNLQAPQWDSETYSPATLHLIGAIAVTGTVKTREVFCPQYYECRDDLKYGQMDTNLKTYITHDAEATDHFEEIGGIIISIIERPGIYYSYELVKFW